MRSTCVSPESFVLRQIDLRLVAGDHHLRIHAESREQHLHLHRRRVLRFVDDDERVAERAAAHEGERRDLDDALLERALHALERHHLVERVVQRPKIRIDLRLHVAGKKAEVLARLDGGSREHDATHTLSRQRVDRRGDGEIRLARSRRSDADDDVVVLNLLEILRLTRRLRLYDFSNARERDALQARCRFPTRHRRRDRRDRRRRPCGARRPA